MDWPFESWEVLPAVRRVYSAKGGHWRKTMMHVELKNLVKKFGDFVAVDQINVSIEKGEFVSLLGGSGCGKTTTLRMIAGFEKPTKGEVVVNGKVINATPAKSRNMGMVFQSYALFPTLTVYENIAFGLKVRKRSKSKINEGVHRLLKLAHMEELSDRYPAQLSGGQQQRVALLRALAIEPTVLLLDEPLSNLDAKLRVEMRNEIKKMQSNLNITTIYVTHDQEEALAISDRIAVMNHGAIHQVGTPVDIYTNPADSFVADFIGLSNFLTCVVVGENQVEFEGQIFNIEMMEKAKTGDKVLMSFRPEYINLYKSGQPDLKEFKGITIPAKLSFEIFLGVIIRMEAMTQGGKTIIIEMPFEKRRDIDCKIGDSVLLSIPSERINVYPI
jgi:ABC-type Fe3+/spermidine/putrescine transport system ATPase subunit